MYPGYQIYQAERGKSAAEQRAIDDRRGELAAAISRRWVTIVGAAQSLRSLREQVRGVVHPHVEVDNY